MTDIKNNILVITIGTREVQIDRDKFPNETFDIDENGKLIWPKQEPENKIAVYSNQDFPRYLSFSEPRKTGEVFNIHTRWQEYICFPIIQPLVDYLKNNQVTLHYILLVDTDQEEPVKQRTKDTLYFSRLVHNYLRNFFSYQNTSIQFNTITIRKDVTNIDKLYPLMEEKGKQLFQLRYEDINQVYLFPQGGIDQINQSLMLKLIQHYRNKVIQFQNAENNQVIPLSFPVWFINDLNREKVRKHIEDFSYSLIDASLINNQEILDIVKYAARKLELDYDEKYRTLSIQPDWIEQPTDENKLKDLYLSAKMHFKRKEYSSYLWKLFTISENYFKPFIADYFQINPDKYYNSDYDKDKENENIEWVNILKKEVGLYEKLKKDRTRLNNPNRIAYIKVISFLSKNGKLQLEPAKIQFIKNTFAQLEKLTQKRNDLAHYLRPLQETDLMIDYEKNYHTKDLNKDLDVIFNLYNDKDYGLYSYINRYLLSLT